MPRRDDISTILILGSGPIVIGQAGEFDYSGTQACRALRADGYKVVLVNSNPATIMTDPEVADRTYIEPVDLEAVTAVIAAERPDALLPTLGGQTALNLAVELSEAGVLAEYGVELLGASLETIRTAEDRELFRAAAAAAGLPVLQARTVGSVVEALAAAEEIGLPVMLRSAYTLGGQGGGMAGTREEVMRIAAGGIDASPIGQVLVERSVAGWGEFELEMMRDCADNAIVVCAIENLDPMGVHTGDSVTVAPAMTLTDDDLQRMRNAAIETLRIVGVETGGANVQFALNRASGELALIEMNPRVSRSSALASKATGVPIARLAARLAVGYTLDELPNEITLVTPASFEPSLDYVAVKAPRFAFEKLPEVDPVLGPSMQSVGEVLALGRSFREAFGKALDARELDVDSPAVASVADALERLGVPRPDRFDVLLGAARLGASAAELSAASAVHPWFCAEIVTLAERERALSGTALGDLSAGQLRAARRAGLTDRMIAGATSRAEIEVVRRRRATGVAATYHAVDTCAAEFPAATSYLYGGFEDSPEALAEPGAVIVLGSGPNRIGQGVEFDYCCVQAVTALRSRGHRAVMLNCNPETVSTDHGVSDRLYLEPMSLGAVLDVCAHERPRGVIAQLGGQTPLRLAAALAAEGVPILGTSPDAIDLAEDRGRFGRLLDGLGLESPPWRMATDVGGAVSAAQEIGFPVIVRPSYVLGGRGMRVCDSVADLEAHLQTVGASGPIFVDAFLAGAIEVDVDGVCDGSETWIAGVMEHVEATGVHSGDSACAIPPPTLGPGVLGEIREQASAIAGELSVVGLVNVQFAVHRGRVVVIEANPRASRTVPFVAKATGAPIVDVAVQVILGATIADVELPRRSAPRHVFVKEAVLPFARFGSADPILGPEMRATGEVMGIGANFAEAFAKAQRGAGQQLPSGGRAFVSASDGDKAAIVAVAADLVQGGFSLVATRGTALALSAAHLPVDVVNKVADGSPHAVDRILGGDIQLVINTPSGEGDRADGASIRRAAVRAGIACATTVEAAKAVAEAVCDRGAGRDQVRCIQEIHGIGFTRPDTYEADISSS